MARKPRQGTGASTVPAHYKLRCDGAWCGNHGGNQDAVKTKANGFKELAVCQHTKRPTGLACSGA